MKNFLRLPERMQNIFLTLYILEIENNLEKSNKNN